MARIQFKLSLFWSTVISLISTYLFLEYGVPYATMLITGTGQWMPVPRSAIAMFMILAFVGAIVYISTSDEKIEEFKEPVLAFLRGDQSGRWPVWAKHAWVVSLAVFPFLLGGFVYFQTRPTVASPTTLRIQHPTIPGAYEKLKNPLRNPDGTVKDPKVIEEGSVLYQRNCGPCHGTAAAGDGPMGWGFRLKPVNFRDPGTIGTLVEAYLFWRIKEGGPSLPPEASPWDSAMPAWKEELSDEEIWKIIVAEYDTAGMEPRKPEKLE